MPVIAMWAAIAVGFVSLARCEQVDQVERRRGHQVSACEKITDQQVRSDCIKGVGR